MAPAAGREKTLQFRCGDQAIQLRFECRCIAHAFVNFHPQSRLVAFDQQPAADAATDQQLGLHVAHGGPGLLRLCHPVVDVITEGQDSARAPLGCEILTAGPSALRSLGCSPSVSVWTTASRSVPPSGAGAALTTMPTDSPSALSSTSPAVAGPSPWPKRRARFTSPR